MVTNRRCKRITWVIFWFLTDWLEAVSAAPDPRIVLVGSVTWNDNTVGGEGVYPVADLHGYSGFKAGFENLVVIADGYQFIGVKAYKDSKLCLMMRTNLLHDKLIGVAFSSIYPGCIAEWLLFRENRAWFRKYFPVFIIFWMVRCWRRSGWTRLFWEAHDPRCRKWGFSTGRGTVVPVKIKKLKL